jgi:fructose-1,6-bisphosphatase/inositol monophosphatase family enzyme
MLPGLGWFLQVIALVLVGSALVFGMIYNQVRLELAVAAAGAALFLLGRWLQSREGR